MISINGFKLEKIIGKGSYGIVYSAKKISTGEIYAIKKINITNLTHYENKSIINELKILACHNCPYIIQYESVFIHLNNIYIITEYAQKGDISQLIKRYKTNHTYFTENQIWYYFIQICIGLRYLHKNNIIHRDIKPANLFIDKNNNIKIGDFGIIKTLQSYMMYAQTLIGTPYYMSPEIYKNQRYNTKIDIWSLGCILYEMITLKLPFNDNNIQGLKYKIFNGKFENIPENIRKKYSPELLNLLYSLININPYRRYSIDDILNIKFIKDKITYMNLNLQNNKIDTLFNQYCIIPKKNSDWDVVVDKYNKISKIGKIDKIGKIKSPTLNKKKFDNNKSISDIDKEILVLNNDILSSKKILNIKIAQLDYLKQKKNNIIIQNNKILPKLPHKDYNATPINLPSIYKYNPTQKPNNNFNNSPSKIKYISKDFFVQYPPIEQRPPIISPKNNLIIKIGSKHENNY